RSRCAKISCYEEKASDRSSRSKNMIMYLNNVGGFKLDYLKGMSYDEIRPIIEAKFNSNIEFLLNTKEQLEEEENRAINSINDTPAQKAAKRRKLNKEVKDLKRHLEIVPDEDDDVYTEATPLARKEVVDVVTIAKLNTKVVTAASETVTAASTIISAAEPQVPAAAITTASPVRVAAASTRRKKGVVIKDPEEESTTIIPADTKSKDKCKGIMVEEPKPLKKKQQIEMDEEYARKLHEELNKDID
nr:hypothetical protein [Tanacetum cinerariifolium]